VHHNLETLEIGQQQIHKVATAGKNSSVSLANNDYQNTPAQNPIKGTKAEATASPLHLSGHSGRHGVLKPNHEEIHQPTPARKSETIYQTCSATATAHGGRRGRGKQREGAGWRIGNWGLGSRPRADLGR